MPKNPNVRRRNFFRSTNQTKLPTAVTPENDIAAKFKEAGIDDSDDNIVSVLRAVYPAEFECDIDDPLDRDQTTLERALEYLWDPNEDTVDEFLAWISDELLKEHDKLLRPHPLKKIPETLNSAYWRYDYAMKLKGEEPVSRDDWNDTYADMLKEK